MDAGDDGRLGRLERELEALAARLDALETDVAKRGWSPAPAAPPRPPQREVARSFEPELAAEPGWADVAVRREPDAEREPLLRRSGLADLTLEDLLGGRLLALVGGIAVLVGVAFLVALAMDRGWIDETTRVGLAAAGSAILFAAGVWLYERRGHTQASLAVVGTAVASLYLTLAAATALYELIPTALALPLAFAIGSTATAFAVRWDAQPVAGLGILGALVAPALVDAGTGATALVFLPVAYAAAQAVLVWCRWQWLAVGAFFAAMPQVALWALDPPPRPALLVTGLAVFVALSLAGGLGHDIRLRRADALLPSSSLLVTATALVLGAVGYAGLHETEGHTGGGLWLAGLACAYAVLAVLAFRVPRGSSETGLLLAGTALMLADIAFGVLADGLVLAIGWSGSAVALAAAARRLDLTGKLSAVPLAGQLALATGHVLLFDAPPGSLGTGEVGMPGDVGAMAAVAAAAFGAARLLRPDDIRWGQILDATAMVALAYATAVALDGAPLAVAYAALAVGLAETAKRTKDPLADNGALAFLALAAGHALLFEAPPDALAYGADSFGAAALALAAVAGAAFRCAQLLPDRRTLLEGAVGVSLLYAASIGIVTVFQPETGAVESNLGLDVRQQGQAILSAFWTICGLAGLWVGLRRNRRDLRLWGFALLGLAVAKVFVYDLSVLSAGYRVLSFVALGLLLLAAAFAYQRMQPPRSPATPTD